jgi:hypothetical protein
MKTKSECIQVGAAVAVRKIGPYWEEDWYENPNCRSLGRSSHILLSCGIFISDRR